MASVYFLNASNDWADGANWSSASAPSTGDTVYILSGTQNLSANLNQSAVTLAALIIGQGFTGTIASSATYLQISATLCYIGQPVTGPTAAIGSGRIKINFGTVQTAVTVFNTSNASTDTGLEPVRLIGTHASNTLNVLGGRVGIGTTYPTEAATMLTTNVTGATVNFGYTVTWGTANVSTGGTLNTQTAGTALTIGSAGTATTNGAVAITTVTNSGTANLNHRASTMCTTINSFGGTVNFSGNPAASIVTTFNAYRGSTYTVSAAVPTHITFTNEVKKDTSSVAYN